MSKAIISFEFQSIAIRTEGDFMSLTDMWKASGASSSKQPSNWCGSSQAKQLLEFLEDSLTPRISGSLVATSKGRNGGTYAHWHLAFAYAKYLSPAFHVWCNEIVKSHMGSEETGASLAIVDALKGLATQHQELLGIVRAQQAQIEDLCTQLVELRKSQTLVFRSRVHPSEASRLKARVNEAARLAARSGTYKSKRSATASMYSRIFSSCGWTGTGTGKTIERMPLDVYPRAECALVEIEREVKRAAQGLQRGLFDAPDANPKKLN